MKHNVFFLRPLALTLALAAFSTCAAMAQDAPAAPPPSLDFFTGQAKSPPNTIQWVSSIAVSSPDYCSNIKGDTTVTFTAPNLTHFKVLCWQQPTPDNPSPWGHDAVVAADVKPDLSGDSYSFDFNADKFPNGPIIIRIFGKSDDGKKQDMCQLQVYNQGGVVWNQGIPKTDPPAAQGMKLAFSDDFDKLPTMSHDGIGATYETHKTGGGDFSDYGLCPFTDSESPLNPYSQVGTFLRIHATVAHGGEKGSTGLLSSLHEDGTGFTATAPCYFECRFLAQSSPGTWPAFWLLTQEPKGGKGADELDVIEAYGGLGAGNPNFFNYAATSHWWDQPTPSWATKGSPDFVNEGHIDVPMVDLGGKSSWSTTFHTYGILITKTDTVYYLDDIEVLRHPTLPHSQEKPFWFLINYALGGISGWKIHMDRYNYQTDMWVDYVRVYAGLDSTVMKD